MENKEILVGSRAFFSNIEGFKAKDKDFVVFVERPKFFAHAIEEPNRGGVCKFYWAVVPKEKFLKYAVRKSASRLEFGKFLVPEVAEFLQLTLEDLKALAERFLPALDKKHKYQEIIYNAYIENGSFTLTDEQRMNAYKVYQKARKENPKNYENHEKNI